MTDDTDNAPSRVSDGEPRFPATGAVTYAAVEVAGVDGAAVSLIIDGAVARDLLHATDADAVRIDELFSSPSVKARAWTRSTPAPRLRYPT